ncbi:hypothetical protein [Azohydromonas aeria]|uniref:hypothetical protein n=1 Tax=Azohydromonas aeria TaxID=2590212 RepID=UPI0012F7C950|nr:hypothetical protein [Azohydromonas aeria]
MSIIRNTLAAASISLLALGGIVQAADESNVGSGTRAAQNEMNRGVPGVDVDVGRNADGAVDVNVNRNNANEPTPARTMNNTGTMDSRTGSGAVGTDPGMRAARADRG